MTIGEMIEKADACKPNSFQKQTKIDWLAELDGKLALDVFLMNIADVREMQYGENTELLVGFPHENMYIHWLCAHIDLANGEYDKYQNTMEAYNACYNNFVNWFVRTYEPANGYSWEVT